jgi:hypothetical protein
VRFSLVMILLLVLSVMMGMRSHAVNQDPQPIVERDCSATEAYNRGLIGQKEPENCKIGQMSAVHESFIKGRIAREERIRSESSEDEGNSLTE